MVEQFSRLDNYRVGRVRPDNAAFDEAVGALRTLSRHVPDDIGPSFEAMVDDLATFVDRLDRFDLADPTTFDDPAASAALDDALDERAQGADDRARVDELVTDACGTPFDIELDGNAVCDGAAGAKDWFAGADEADTARLWTDFAWVLREHYAPEELAPDLTVIYAASGDATIAGPATERVVRFVDDACGVDLGRYLASAA